MRSRSASVLTSHLFTRPRYSPDSVLTLMISPVVMNRGTCTSAPVSSVADLVAFPDAVLPCEHPRRKGWVRPSAECASPGPP